MDSDDGEVSNNSDLELDPKQHAKLVDNVLSLNKKPQLKKPSRTEPTLEISEFNLVKSVTGKQGSINVSDLTKVLKKGAKHVEISKKALATKSAAKTLPKPLEKPQADRIRRSIAYENVRNQLDRWDAIVTSNRGMNHLSFPLRTDFDLESGNNFTNFRLKSDLQKKLESLHPKVEETEVFKLEDNPKYPLTLQEILEHRKEGAKMRAVQSYREAKARRQNKIKSKKFHRIQRKEKIKNQLKEFEQLQKTNPEEALKKLDEIERVRAQERASLKHRSTSKWAKNKQIRAKYDKDSRQALAQQLAISRDLTQKLKVGNDDSESEEEIEGDPKVPKHDGNNPWTKDVKTDDEVQAFISGYRKFWEDTNKKSGSNIENSVTTDKSDLNETKTTNTNNRKQLKEIKLNGVEAETEKPSTINTSTNKGDTKVSKRKTNKIGNLQDTTKSAWTLLEAHKPITRSTKRKHECLGTTEWSIDVFSDASEADEKNNDNELENIDKMFDNFECKLQSQLKSKYKELKKDFETIEREKQKQDAPKKTKTQQKKIKLDLNPNPVITKPIIDEELTENDKTNGGELPETNKNLAVLDRILKNNESSKNSKKTSTAASNINPEDIIKTKPVSLNTEIPDLFNTEENEENSDQRGIILEAFEDDDIVNKFVKDKQDEINKNKPQDVNLTLPGWGDWGGVGIQESKRKSKRFIVKFPKQAKRRDDNKGDVVINERANSKSIKPHLVSEIPFPFKSVKDFEASVRAPISNTFIPETAYRRIIKPAIKTKMGTIIEPMTEEVLLKKKK